MEIEALTSDSPAQMCKPGRWSEVRASSSLGFPRFHTEVVV